VGIGPTANGGAGGDIGGVSTIQQYLRAGLVDEMHLAYSPLLLGSVEPLLDDLADAPDGYEIAEFVGTAAVLHVRFMRKAAELA